MAAGELREPRARREPGDVAADREAERPGEAAAHAGDLARRGGGHGQDAPGAVVEEPARLRERDASRPPADELRPELSLELGELVGERRLRDVQAPGGRGDLALLGDGDEVLELLEIQGPSLETLCDSKIVWQPPSARP